MGLDWVPINKPKPGHEDEFFGLLEGMDTAPDSHAFFSRLWALVAGKKLPPLRATLIERYNQIGIDPCESLGAPRVGYDEIATSWAKEQFPKRIHKSQDLSTFLRELHGVYVVELLSKHSAVSEYSIGKLSGDQFDMLSFRGEILRNCEGGVLSDDLLEEAWENHYRAEDTLDYGRRLMNAAEAYASDQDITEVLNQPEPPEDDDGPLAQAHVLISAARYCLFWGNLGHGIKADW